jgi:phospholipase/carboxylesterase
MLETELVPAADRTSRRLMIVLHGLGDSLDGYRWLPDALGLTWLNYLLVNAPDEYYGGWSWFDFAHDPAPGIRRSRKALTELLDQQRAAGYPSEQTTLFGFSQGCLMTLDVGLRYPHRLAGLVGISGWVHDPDTLLAELPPVAFEQRVLITHGTDDPMVPFAPVREQINQLKAEGLHIEWHEFVKGHTIAGEDELAVIRDFVKRGYG